MDKEQAKFILQSFRPDGSDASDADFAEALGLAASDRDLGEWLADERAADAEFATALSCVEIPEELRQQILCVMHGEKLSDPELDQEFDSLLQDGFADVEPPERLREQILAAMEIQRGEDKIAMIPPARAGNIRKFISLAAVAAALVLGAFVAFQVTSNRDERLASHEIQYAAGNLLNTQFNLDEKSDSIANINNWLVSNDLPTTDSLPPRLQGMKSLGCKKIMLPGEKSASLVCFTEDAGGSVHLVIIKNEDVKDNELPTMDKVREDDCYHCPKTDWNVARWKDSKHTFILMKRSGKERKNDLLRYF